LCPENRTSGRRNRHSRCDPPADILLQSSLPIVRAGGRVHPPAGRRSDVVAIKQTVYRTGRQLGADEALIQAALRGKEVTVVVELMARFDEEANINWAEKLEHAGAQVVYGVFGLQDPRQACAAAAPRARRQGMVRLVPYAHLGTGNYHPRTTGLYPISGS